MNLVFWVDMWNVFSGAQASKRETVLNLLHPEHIHRFHLATMSSFISSCLYWLYS